MQASNPLTMITQELCLIRKSFILNMSVSFKITVPERFWKPEILRNSWMQSNLYMGWFSLHRIPSNYEIFILKVFTWVSLTEKKKKREIFTIWIRVREMELRALTRKHLNNLSSTHWSLQKKLTRDLAEGNQNQLE